MPLYEGCFLPPRDQIGEMSAFETSKRVEEMQKDTKNVLLMSRDIKNDTLDQMMEIVFKEQ